MKKASLLLTGIILLFSLHGSSQQLSNLRKKSIAFSSVHDTLSLDSMSVIPHSLTITYGKNNTLDTNLYTINEASGLVIFNGSKLKSAGVSTDSLQFTYKVFPYQFSKVLQHKNTDVVHPTLYAGQQAYYYQAGQGNNPNDPLDLGTLNKSGSISRGVTFGNSQNLSVNSNLNLQLAGKLSNNVNVLVAATDNNLPIQPEGNTQQLQDFDKVFVKLYNRDASIIAGDFELASPQDYFMKFYKKSEGGMITSRFILKPNSDSNKAGILKASVAGGISKGQFQEDQITPIDGNLGPYLLTANGATFIVILSGTEKVYLDGQLLQRGANNDYVIDYNAAQITFTPKHLITQNSRIIVQFQYSNQNYLRSLFHTSVEYNDTKLSMRFNTYSEQDAKNQPLLQSLSPQQIQLLAGVGDTLKKAIAPGIDSVAFNSTEVLYRKVDTIVNTINYIAYVYSTDSTKAHFLLSFSQVPQGQGDYIQIASAANGRVFQWKAPISGVHQGNFEPVIQLIAPKQKQMATLATDYRFNKNTSVSVEGAVTNNNINTFSTYDKNNDVGYAGKVGFHNVTYFADSATNKGNVWKLTTNLGYEGVQRNFSPIETYRSIEFARDWNRTSDTIYDNQNLLNGNLTLANKKDMLGYGFNSFLENGDYNGMKHLLNLKLNELGFLATFNGSLLNTTTTDETSNYFKEAATISHKLLFWVVGGGETSEKDEFRSRQTDSIINTSSTYFEQANTFHYYQWNAFIRSGDSSKNSYGINYQERTDFGAKLDEFEKSLFSRNISLDLNLAKNPKNRFKANVTYHILTVYDSALANGQQPVNALVGQAQYDLTVLHGVLFSSTFYQAGSGLQPEQEYTYVQVAQGQGVYAWTDYNHDGVKQLNEFYVSPFPDEADYIRVYTPTSNYIKTYTSAFTETFNLRPAAVWATKKGLRGFIARFSEQIAIHIDKKTTASNPLDAYNPFFQQANDTNVVGLNTSIRNTVFFNQLNPKFGADYTYSATGNKTILEEDGAQSRQNDYQQLHARCSFTTKWMIEGEGKLGEDISSSQYFSTSNFYINYYELQPKLTYQPSTAFRTAVLFTYSSKDNAASEGGGLSQQQNYGVEVRYNVLSKGSLTATFNYVKIAFNGEATSPLGFEMLQGLNIGNNYTWSVTYQVNLSGNIQLSLMYNGRDTQGAKVINTGTAQVRAFF